MIKSSTPEVKEVPTSGVKISVIIPCKNRRDLCPELIPALKSQTLKPLEILIITDKICAKTPAEKRDFAAKKAKGEILAFIDSDAYPAKNWLQKAGKYLQPTTISAVCGPGLTPETDSPFQQISGLVWSSWIGAGPYAYRCCQKSSRYVDDYPTFNFLVKKSAFQKVKGFNTDFWPGEDTKLCHDLVYRLNTKILYHPNILVYHHRRPIFISHLQQISRYGFQRGRFIKIFPKNSLRFSYFLPLLLPLIFPFYLIVLLLTGIIHRSLILIPAILLTHLVYALFFLKGLFTKVEPL